jgi:hypothetical protein
VAANHSRTATKEIIDARCCCGNSPRSRREKIKQCIQAFEESPAKSFLTIKSMCGRLLGKGNK